jgi:hypothetical protein
MFISYGKNGTSIQHSFSVQASHSFVFIKGGIVTSYVLAGIASSSFSSVH